MDGISMPVTPSTSTRTRPPRLLTNLDTGLPTPTSASTAKDIIRQTRSSSLSPPTTPQSPVDPFHASPGKSALTFDLSLGQQIGSGLWCTVYRIPATVEPATESGSALSTPPATPQRTVAPTLPRIYAVKVASRPDAIDVFAQEAEILSHLQSHPAASRFIVPFFGPANAGRALAFHAATCNLEEYSATRATSASQSPLDLFPVLARQLTSALAFIHGAGVIHADIKPSNILVDLDPSDGRSTVIFRFCDFSASSLVDEQGLDDTPDTGLMSSLPSTPIPSRTNSARRSAGAGAGAGAGGGTWTYMAPEQISSNKSTSTPTVRSDVYSLGMTLLTLLLGGRNPYAGLERSYSAIMLREAIKQGDPLRFARDDLDLACVLDGLEGSPRGQDALRLIGLAVIKARDGRVASSEWPMRCDEVFS